MKTKKYSMFSGEKIVYIININKWSGQAVQTEGRT